MSKTRRLTMAQAIAEGIAQEMERDESVFVMGEDIGAYGGIFGATGGLLEKFGRERIMDTPISETAFIGAATGAAAAGMRPIVELMFVDFFGVCMDQIYNHLAKNTYMAGGNIKLPVVLTTAIGGGYNDAAQHSQCLYATFAHMPGLKVVVPSNAYDAKGLMIQAIRDDNPVMFMYHKGIMGLPWMAYFEGSTNEVPEAPYTLPFGQATAVREGKDLTHRHDQPDGAQGGARRRRAGANGDQRRGDRPAHAGAARSQRGVEVGRQDRAPAGRRRGLPRLRSQWRDRGHRRREPRHAEAQGTDQAPRRTQRSDPVQPAAGAVRDSAGERDRRGGEGLDEGPDARRRRSVSDVALPASAWEGVEAGVEALLDQWLVAVGDAVHAGQPLARVVLVKASLEVEAPSDGQVESILVAAGETFARGQPVAVFKEAP